MGKTDNSYILTDGPQNAPENPNNRQTKVTATSKIIIFIIVTLVIVLVALVTSYIAAPGSLDCTIAHFFPSIFKPCSQELTFWGVDLDDPGYSIDHQLVQQFSDATGIPVKIITKPRDTTEAFIQLQKMLTDGDPPDVMVLDVFWIGKLATYLRELRELEQEAREAHFPTLIENNTIDENNTVGDKLIAIPWFADFGVLYYRTDLLAGNGYTHPPTTWQELEDMARTIQANERAKGKSDFWGFVWQGAAYEGLTCNVLEWIASSDGGQIISNGGQIVDEQGNIIINDEAAKQALNRAKSWIGNISDPDVISFKEDRTLERFRNKKAAFMRYWPTAYTTLTTTTSLVITEPLQFDIAPLPSLDGKHSVGTLGGAALGIYRNTDNEQAAVEFVRFMTSRNTEMTRAFSGSFIATRSIRDPIRNNPQLSKVLTFLDDHPNYTVNRPSTVTQGNYDKVTRAIYENVHEMLTGNKNVDDVVKQIKDELQASLR